MMDNLKPFTIYKMKGINYIGSTCDLRVRLKNHNYDCFGQCKNQKVYQHIRQNYLTIELIPIAHIFVGDKARKMIKQVFIDKYDSIENGYNTIMAYQTSCENKERNAKQKKAHYEKNRERLLKQKREYYEKNKERVVKRQMEHRNKNKDAINAKRRAKAPCPHCQKVMRKGSITRHIKNSCKAITSKI